MFRKDCKLAQRVSDFLLIEFRQAGSTTWEHLGRFTVAPSELADIKKRLARCANAYDLLKGVPKKGIIFDTLEVLKSEGHFARIRFPE